MKVPIPPFVRSFFTRSISHYQRWIWISILASVLVGILLSVLHFRQQQTTREMTQAIINMHLARIELSKGFLYVSLSGEPGAPFDREEGLALLRQATQSLERTANADTDLLTASELADFQRSVDAFQVRLDEYSAAAAPQPKLETDLRIAFHALERQADSVDQRIHQRLETLSNRLDWEFLLTLTVSALLLLGMCLVVLFTGRAKEKSDIASQEREQKLNQLLSILPIGISILDAKRQVVFSNPSLKQILHMTETGLASGAYKNRGYLQADGSPMPADQFASTRAIQSGQPVFGVETGVVSEDGKTIWTSVSAVPVNFSDWRTVIAITDITERKRAEQILQQSEREHRELMENANSAIIRWKSDGTIVFFNEYAQDFFGYRPDEIIGKQVSIIVPPTESTGGDLSGLVNEIAAHPEQFIKNVNENICKDGRRAWMIWTNKPVYNENGQLEEILAVGSDISENKRMEEELRRSNAELEQFAYVASHDLQEPLRAVAGMVQLLGQRYKGKLDERADEYIDHAVEASTRMQNLINDLLDYSRVERLGKPFAQTQVEHVLEIALANLQISIRESGAQITYDPLPIVLADAGQLTQVFQNLIGNAIKFCGGKAPQIHIGAQKEENAWHFSVQDNGIGIEPQYFERIFLVFQRLHTRREYPGTGIGLSLCKKIIERHGGRIWVESQPGHGSTFHFTLPEKKT